MSGPNGKPSGALTALTAMGYKNSGGSNQKSGERLEKTNPVLKDRIDKKYGFGAYKPSTIMNDQGSATKLGG